jgi:hypothetical protein
VLYIIIAPVVGRTELLAKAVHDDHLRYSRKSIMKLSLVVLAIVLASVLVGGQHQDRCGDLSRCLRVFDHKPAHLPKCYCTSICEKPLAEVARNCASNQLLADDCGACLVCARALGQSCGGMRNIVGTCAGGLVCKVHTFTITISLFLPNVIYWRPCTFVADSHPQEYAGPSQDRAGVCGPMRARG